MAKFHCYKNPENGELSWDKAGAEGYPDWEVVGEASRLPRDHEEHDPATGRFTINKERRERKAREAQARDPEQLSELIGELQTRLAVVEAELAALKGK